MSQQLLIRASLNDAGARTESFIEVHGTGTALGDPIEVGAVSSVLLDQGSKCFACGIKANVGHTESMAGVSGTLKVLTLLQQEVGPPNAQTRCVNPQV
jgi:acyl transferase domain-containing protein